MRKGCLLSLLLLAALCGGYYAVFDRMFEPPGDLYGALAAGFLSWIGVGFLQNARQSIKDAGSVSRSLKGSFPRNGELYAAVGSIHPERTPLKAPFSETECVAYTVEIIDETGGGDDDRGPLTKFVSFAMAPCYVRTPVAQVKILGLPMLDSVPKSFLDSGEARNRAQIWVRDTAFENLSGLQIVKAFSEITGVLGDADGEILKNWRMTKDNDISELTLSEQLLKVGEPVCILGTYSQALQGLAPNLSKSEINRLLLGDPQSVAKSLRAKVIPQVFGSLIFLIAAAAGSFGVLTLREQSDDILRAKSESLFIAVREQDVQETRRLIARRAPLERTNGNYETALMTADSPEIIAELIAAGADINTETDGGHTPLMHAAHANKPALAKALIEAGVDINKAGRKWGQTALETAEDAGNQELAEQLRAAGAEGGAVTARTGTPLQAENSEQLQAVSRYLDAIQAKDSKTAKDLVHGWKNDFFDTVDWEVWKGSRLIDFQLKEGFVRQDAATLIISGITGAGYQAEWTYHLKRDGQQWKIHRERWNTDALH